MDPFADIDDCDLAAHLQRASESMAALERAVDQRREVVDTWDERAQDHDRQADTVESERPHATVVAQARRDEDQARVRLTQIEDAMGRGWSRARGQTRDRLHSEAADLVRQHPAVTDPGDNAAAWSQRQDHAQHQDTATADAHRGSAARARQAARMPAPT